MPPRDMLLFFEREGTDKIGTSVHAENAERKPNQKVWTNCLFHCHINDGFGVVFFLHYSNF